MRTYVRLEVVAYEHMRRRFIAPFLLVGAMLMSACGSSSTPTVETLDLFVDDTTVQSTTPAAVTTTTIPLPLSPIVWDKCSPSETKGIKCGTIKVPYSYEDPAIGTFTLSLKVHSAEDAKKRIGSLIVNRGGPGAESASMAPDAGFYFSQTILDHFDIVAFDPRGTGASTPFVDCVAEYDSYFASDVTPNTQIGRAHV